MPASAAQHRLPLAFAYQLVAGCLSTFRENAYGFCCSRMPINLAQQIVAGCLSSWHSKVKQGAYQLIATCLFI